MIPYIVFETILTHNMLTQKPYFTEITEIQSEIIRKPTDTISVTVRTLRYQPSSQIQIIMDCNI